MISIQNRLDAYYQKAAGVEGRRLSGEGWISRELTSETVLLDRFKAADNGPNDRDSAPNQIELHHRGHCLAPPTRHIASWNDNTLSHEYGIFITSGCTHGTPTFNTLSETTFTDAGMVKRSATEGPSGVSLRTVVVDRNNLANSYVEEFNLAP